MPSVTNWLQDTVKSVAIVGSERCIESFASETVAATLKVMSLVCVSTVIGKQTMTGYQPSAYRLSWIGD